MGVKSLVFLGLVISALFAYLCINSKKDAFYASINQEVPKVVKPIPIPEKVILKDPSFAYVMGVKSKVAGLLSTKDKDGKITKMIDDICGDSGCIKDIKYFDDTKEFGFSDEVLKLINLAIEKNIDNFAIYIDKKIVKVEGVLQDTLDGKEIDLVGKHFMDNGYEFTNSTHTKDKKPEEEKKKNVVDALQKSKPVKEVIVNKSKIVTKDKNITTKPPVKEEVKEVKKKEKSKKAKEEKVPAKVEKKIIKKEEAPKPIKKVEKVAVPKPVEKATKPKPIKKAKKEPKKVLKKAPIEDVTVDDVFVIPEHVSSEEASYRIGDLLVVEPIMFESEDGRISQDSRNTLDKISDILLGLDNISIVVEGYFDDAGDLTYNKVLSQKRADSVRNYLVKSGIRRGIIRSVGHSGSSQAGDPSYTSIEIKIKEGK